MNLFSQVQSKILPDRWFYLSITWTKEKGLVLFKNGRQYESDKLGKVVSGLQINEDDTNFVIGRSFNEAVTSLAKFWMSSFTVFDSYISNSVMRSVFSFYWRAGK